MLYLTVGNLVACHRLFKHNGAPIKKPKIMCEVRGSGSSYWSWASKICPHHLSRAAFPQHWVSLTHRDDFHRL